MTRTAALCTLLVDTPGAARILAGAELPHAMAQVAEIAAFRPQVVIPRMPENGKERD